MASKPRYHHGNLRAALLTAAFELLESDGLEALTLRAVASRAGVSHAAPAHHFPNLRSLLTGVASIGFERFSAALAAARRNAAAGPLAQARAAGQGYVDFAVAHPALFRLMFQAGRLDWSDAGLKAAAGSAYGQLAEVAAPLAEALGGDPAIAGRQAELLVWSSVHGYAHLLLEGQIDGLLRRDGFSPGPPDIAALILGGGPATHPPDEEEE